MILDYKIDEYGPKKELFTAVFYNKKRIQLYQGSVLVVDKEFTYPAQAKVAWRVLCACSMPSFALI